MSVYKSNTITITTAWTELDPTFDIHQVSLYSSDGDYEFQFKIDGAYGDTITGLQSIAIEEFVNCSDVRVWSKSGSIDLYYYLEKE